MELNKDQIKELHKSLVDLTVVFRDVCDREGIWYSLAYGTLLGAVREKNIIQWDTDVDVFVKYDDLPLIREAFIKYHYDGIVYKNYDAEKRCLTSHDNLISNRSSVIPDIHLDIYPIVGAPSNKSDQDKISFLWSYMDKVIRSKYVDIRQCLPKNKLMVAIAKVIDYCIPDKYLKANIKKRETKFDMRKTGYWMNLSCYGPGRSCFPISFLDGFDEKELGGEKFKVMKEWHKYLTIVYGDYMTPKKY